MIRAVVFHKTVNIKTVRQRSYDVVPRALPIDDYAKDDGPGVV